MKIGTVCPVWAETRYLPLVLEQMSLCPGPALVVWQDKPLYWEGEGHAPSGHRSGVEDILARFPKIEVMKIDHAPPGPAGEEFGGFKWLQKMAFVYMKATYKVDAILWSDSDWLFDLNMMQQFYYELEVAEVDRKLWSVEARHYWRDFGHTLADSPVTAVFPIDVPHLWSDYTEDQIHRSRYTLYHPAYILTDAEMYQKVCSWGHAPLFKERGFYEKEWLPKNDSIVNPKPSDVVPSANVWDRLKKWNALICMCPATGCSLHGEPW